VPPRKRRRFWERGHHHHLVLASSVCDWIDLNCTDGRVANIMLVNNLLVGAVPFYEMGALSELGKFHHCMHAAAALDALPNVSVYTIHT
jgi:hypothetical protein